MPGALSLSQPASVAVVGAGIAGLACARRLVERGFTVRVFDKARGTGGRLSTRRTETRGETWHFDHGAQYFTIRDGAFAETMGRLAAEGWVSAWDGAIAILEDGGWRLEEDGPARYVGVPGMSGITRRLAMECPVVPEVRVDRLVPRGRAWRLRDDAGEDLGRFDLVVVAVPAPRAVPLLAAAPGLATAADQVRMLPTWALMLGFDQPLDLPFDAAFVHDSPLSWVARNSAKPGRPAAEAWVLHGDHLWSREHLEDEPGAVVEALLGAFHQVLRQGFGHKRVARWPRPVHRAAHRWRHAVPESPLPERCLLDLERGLGACGDWCGGPRVEGAFLSGRALADALLDQWGDLAGPAA